MGKFFDWLRDGGPKEDFGAPEDKKIEPVKVEKEESDWAETPEEKEASREARKEWIKKEREAFEAYVSKGPEFKIVQVPAGHFVIMRRHTGRIATYAFVSETYGHVRKANFWEGLTYAPYDQYETVKNTDAPIMVKEYSPYPSYGGEYRLSGYADLAFNIFEDAEAYLFRMAQPQDHEVGYDFPPLKRRANKKKGSTK